MAKKNYLSPEECLKIVQELGRSQGFYSRLAQELREARRMNEVTWEIWEDFCKDNKFQSSMDLIFALEV